MYEAERFTVATVVDLMEHYMHKVAQTSIFYEKIKENAVNNRKWQKAEK